MNDYNGENPEVRKEALKKLWQNFQDNPNLRKKCTDPKHPRQARRAAWEALKAAGDFQDDPDGFNDVEVRIFEGGAAEPGSVLNGTKIRAF
ncbi:hypothetical protein BH20VER3_BH20VER3_15370 [soil metagenome]